MRPDNVEAEPFIGRALRGPDDVGRWYWVARARLGGERQAGALGWLTRPDAVVAIRRLAERGRFGEPVEDHAGTVAWLTAEFAAHLEVQETLRAKIVGRGAQPKRGHRLPGVARGTVLAYRKALGEVVAHYGGLRLDALRRTLPDDFYAAMVAGGLAETTAQLYTRVLLIAWGWGHEHEHITRPPPKWRCSAAPLPKREPTREEIAEILGRFDGWMRTYVSIQAGTGMRTSEIGTLRRGDIDVEHRMIRLRYVPGATKTGARSIPIPDWLWPVVAPLAVGDAEESVWPVSAPVGTIQREVRKRTGFRPKSLRDAACTAWETSGAPSWVIDGAMGNTAATRRAAYGSHPDDDATAWARAAAPGDAPVTGDKVTRLEEARAARGSRRGSGRR